MNFQYNQWHCASYYPCYYVAGVFTATFSGIYVPSYCYFELFVVFLRLDSRTIPLGGVFGTGLCCRVQHT